MELKAGEGHVGAKKCLSLAGLRRLVNVRQPSSFAVVNAPV